MARVVSVQLDVPEGEAKLDRVARASALVASLEGFDLIVLPEVWNVGYFNFDRYAAEAEMLDGPTVARMAEAARTAGAYVMAGSIVERDEDRLFNTSVLLGPDGGVVGTYRKIHLFGYGSREPDILTRGDLVSVMDSALGRIGLATCYDLRFPELFRAMVDDGAELFIVPSAWPYPRVEAWTVLNRARAIENQAWLVSANCTGSLGGLTYCGRSVIVDPWGTPVATGGDGPGLVVGEIDIEVARTARVTFPALRDRMLGPEAGASVRPFVDDRSGAEIGFQPREVVLAGYTGRDQAAVKRHVEELAAHGVPAPESVPAFYRVSPDRVVVADRIGVLGNETSGEGEFLIFRWDDELWIGVASDHTDRASERGSIRLSKQLCPKPVCPRVWRFAEVASHWDRIVLRSFCGNERPEQLYQEGPVTALLDPEVILAGAAGRAGADADGGLLVFSGTLPLLGELSFARSFAVELADEERGTRLRVEYAVDVAEPLD